MRYITWRLFILLGGIFSSCDRSEHLSESQMEKIVHDRNGDLEKAFLNQDTSLLSKVYAQDARLSPNGDNFYVGREAILKFWQADFETSKLLKMSTTTLSVSGDADVIYETGLARTETEYQDSVYKSEVKFVNVWRKQADDSYQLAIDFWNSPKRD